MLRERKTKIVNGHPFTDGDNKLFSDLSPEQQITLLMWIKYGLLPSKGINPHRTSYGLKQEFEWEAHFYLTNNQFKDAMLMCGFAPADETELNWRFRIKERSPALMKE